VFHAGHLSERGDETAPVGALLGEHAAARVGDAVVAAPPLARFFDPPSPNPAAIFEAVQRRVERGEREAEPAIRARLDELRDLVPVVALVLDDREDHELGAALLGFVDRTAAGHVLPPYMKERYI